MNTLIIYDGTGYIISQMSGDVREPIGLPFLWVEIPEKKRIVSIDVLVTPNIPVYEDITKTEIERLKEEDLNNKEAIAELYMMSMGGV